MQWKNSATRYGHISLLIHWLVAIVVYGMFALGLWMVTLGYYDSWYHQAPEIHKSIGILLFIVMAFRVIWRFISPSPKPLESYSRLTKISSAIAQILIYVILFSILISGYLISTADGQPISVLVGLKYPLYLLVQQHKQIQQGIFIFILLGQLFCYHFYMPLQHLNITSLMVILL